MSNQQYRHIMTLLAVLIALTVGQQIINLALLTDIQHAVVPGR